MKRKSHYEGEGSVGCIGWMYLNKGYNNNNNEGKLPPTSD